MRAFPSRRLASTVLRFALVCACALFGAKGAFAQAQSNAADLRGFVRDPQGAVVAGATVTARQTATNTVRTATSNEEGLYQFTNLPPGDYELTVEAANFKRAVVPAIALTVGQQADLDVALELGGLGETVTVTGATTELVETSRTAVANTVDQQRIENLPINQRDYINFTLTTSTVTRDNGRPIGPAPTSGLNFGGQRGRSNLVQVDGADNTDNSVNAARSTVSQEAVQEFQVVSNSYAAEFGRTSGGVVNVVTKSGTNDVRGNVFGFIRHKSIQARNPFAPIIDNDPDKKPPFTRAQYGATIGGPLARDTTFAFFAFEQRKRQESGFFTSDVEAGLNSAATIPAIPELGPLFPAAITFNRLTPAQAAFIPTAIAQGRALLANANPAIRAQGQSLIIGTINYAYLASGGGNTALTGFNPLVVAPAASQLVVGSAVPIASRLAPGQVVGSRFFLAGTPIPFTTNAQGQPIAFRPLFNLERVFPISEDTTFSSLRVDHKINDANQMYFRVGYNPSDITGIQVESQNQALGQNDFSRTGIQTLRDASFVTAFTSTLSNSVVNEARFNFGSRRATFKSQNGEAVAFNITGTAFIGRELFSPVLRTENRYQFTDNVNWIVGNHNFKFGGDAAAIQVDATFELNFAGLFNFGGLAAGTFVPGSPEITPVQQYGMGFPGNFIQGFGDPNSKISNRPLAVFAQDSWKVRPNLTLNYGVRYDVELTREVAPRGFSDTLRNGISLTAAQVQAAQDFFNVQQGFPRDKNNIAPRVGLAWDINNDGKTVIRAAYGIFYDHPLLGIAFNSDIADNVQQQQFVSAPGLPCGGPAALPCGSTLNASAIFQGVVFPGLTQGVAPTAEYQLGRQRFNDQTFPGFGPVLPFPLPVSRDFEYAYANQANAQIERQLTKNMSFTAGWLFTGAHHLPHPTNLNPANNNLLIQNFVRCNNRQPVSTAEVLSLSPSTCANIVAQPIPGLVAVTTRGAVVQPFAANLFRPGGPNYFFVQSVTGGAVTPAVFNNVLTATGALARPGVVSTFGDVNAQVSDGNSIYHAGNFELKKRFSHNFQFLASYTWSHAIDDSSDLQTLLLPQDANNLRAERADSLFDQRHRFVFSGVLAAPDTWRTGDAWRRVLADFVVAPIFEISSGRPFNILTGVDTNNDQTGQTDRPNVAADGTLVLPPPFTSGNLGRNRGITQSYASLDLRVTRKIRLGERFHLDVIAEGFNLFNRFNQAAASPLFTDVNAFGRRDGSGRYYSRPTAAFDPRQFQFGLKLNF
ncbi:MAG TPA: TonB-dependent receptor [Pyrinomonadaceae bacterium]|nr:TonB-dependent receptor [Pyrinomonadaceae bacterium]